jgi:hypothetical protein
MPFEQRGAMQSYRSAEVNHGQKADVLDGMKLGLVQLSDTDSTHWNALMRCDEVIDESESVLAPVNLRLSEPLEPLFSLHLSLVSRMLGFPIKKTLVDRRPSK